MRRLGEGSFGCVYMATCPTSHVRVALKRLAGTCAPHRAVAELEMQLRAGNGSAGCVPALLGGFRDQVRR